MRVYNNKADYPESFGQYTVQFFTSKATGQFTALILTPLFEKIDLFRNWTKYVIKSNLLNLELYEI
ncbi:hypothetical protein [Candidatus Trichorickettsia mobilis]|uniref:hypothetical protein n=1 Tax=Candidatus Trichorickettsia mobilis TaxID=1346319 RepID=UPI00292EB0C0|nr:hypothetical protein [Candidatus Trichorickettsia mobilis]